MTQRRTSYEVAALATEVDDVGAGLLVEALAGEVHQRVAEQLDLDPIGILQVHGLLDATVGADVLPPRSVQPVTHGFPAVPGRGYRDVLHPTEGLDPRLEP